MPDVVRRRVRCVPLLLMAAIAISGSVSAQGQAREGRRVDRAAHGRGPARSARHLDQRHAHAARAAAQSRRSALSHRGRGGGASKSRRPAPRHGRRASAKRRIGSYNQFWFDSGTTVLPTRQTSLVVDPPDGRVPVRPEAEARRDEFLGRSAESPEFMSVWDRCISRGVPGWIIPAGYNNAYQIVQTRGHVVIHAEMIHDARIIPLARPSAAAAGHVRLLEGDSRGRWDGDTLVVETTNFSDRNWIATSAASGRIKGIRRAPRCGSLNASRESRPIGSTTRRASRIRPSSRSHGRSRFR